MCADGVPSINAKLVEIRFEKSADLNEGFPAIPKRNLGSCLAAHHKIESINLRANHRKTRGHRFEDREWHPLIEAGDNECIGAGVKRRKVSVVNEPKVSAKLA